MFLSKTMTMLCIMSFAMLSGSEDVLARKSPKITYEKRLGLFKYPVTIKSRTYSNFEQKSAEQQKEYIERHRKDEWAQLKTQSYGWTGKVLLGVVFVAAALIQYDQKNNHIEEKDILKSKRGKFFGKSMFGNKADLGVVVLELACFYFGVIEPIVLRYHYYRGDHAKKIKEINRLEQQGITVSVSANGIIPSLDIKMQ